MNKYIGKGISVKGNPIDFLEELKVLTKLKPVEYGIAYRRDDTAITMLNNFAKAEDISLDLNKSRLYHNNKLFAFLNNALLSKKESAPKLRVNIF